MRRRVLLLLAVTTLAAGCAAPAHRVYYRPGARPTTARAPTDGDYLLFRTDGLGCFVTSTPVPRGGRVGFRTENGAPVALAGDCSIPLEAGEYAWIRRDYDPEAERYDRRLHRIKNISLAAGGIVLAGVAAAGVVGYMLVSTFGGGPFWAH